MTFLELVKLRQSVRRFSQQPVEDQKLKQCIEAARLAPSASNAQPWKFVVVNQEPLRTEVAKATFSDIQLINKFTLQAPLMVIIVTEKTGLVNRLAMKLKGKQWPLIDAGIAAEHFCLQAAELGLGTCMIGWFDEQRIKHLLKIPDNKSIALCLAVGYPEEGYRIREKIRKPQSEMMSENTY